MSDVVGRLSYDTDFISTERAPEVRENHAGGYSEDDVRRQGGA